MSSTIGQFAVEQRTAKFEIGEIVITPAATAALDCAGLSIDDLLDRHRSGDWGDVSDRTRTLNERGLLENFNLQSVYSVRNGDRLMVVTNRERTLTMVHMDYRGV